MADQILRNYRQLQNVHSNHSVRKLLEQEARRELFEKEYPEHIPRPVISVVRDSVPAEMNPNTLPYLHRNPAI